MQPGEVFLGVMVVLGVSFIAFPLARALADRIRGRPVAAPNEDIQTLRDDVMQELQHVRHELAELGERVDFTERLLAKQRDPERLARGDR